MCIFMRRSASISGAIALATTTLAISYAPTTVLAQQTLPKVEVTAPRKKAAPAKAAPAKAVKQAPPVVEQAPPAEGSAQRAAAGPLSPIDARQALPGDLQNVPGSAGRVTAEKLNEQRPLTNHDALMSVPGIVVVADDGWARHGGVGSRGSPFRRSRKVLVMEDGVPINFSTYLDSSVHYTPPLERVESIEVLKGPLVNYGPLNNQGVINFRNLSPFGADETVIKAGIGTTAGTDHDINVMRHIHTRKVLGNAGVVMSYSGLDAGGSWDVEKLAYNDFYGAIGFKGINQDLTISGGYFRQRDRYDEDNFSGPRADFFRLGHNKRAGADQGFFESDCGACYDFSNYNGDHYRLQLAHNLYFDKSTTLSTRIYGNHHHRSRFFPSGDRLEDLFNDGIATDDQLSPTNLAMEGRDRLYQNYGADSRLEMANLSFFGLKHTLQAGIRYEEHSFSNKNRVGGLNERLDSGNRGEFDEGAEMDAQSFAAFVQSAIKVTPTLTVVPGVRLESYSISFVNSDGIGGSSDYTHVLPMLSFAWQTGLRTTVYGGYHRGFAPHILREYFDDATAYSRPLEEVGDNFQVGVRTKAIRGLTLEASAFHSLIDNYQFGEAFQTSNDRSFGILDKVAFTGFEILGRVDSNAFTGGPWNVFGEVSYTFVDSEIRKGTHLDEDQNPPIFVDVAGNKVPESIRHFANLTLGLQHKSGWDASLTWTYRGAFFTDAFNKPADPTDVAVGEVDDVWLLSARANYKVTDQLTLWASGHNLTDELYITDLSDGARPGLGRTVMGGFTIKLD